MDKRTLLALGLMVLVIVVTPKLFPTKRSTPSVSDSSSSTAVSTPNGTSVGSPPPTNAPAVAPATAAAPSANMGDPRRLLARTVAGTLNSTRARLELVSPGATPSRAVVSGYRDLRVGKRGGDSVALTTGAGPLLSYRIATGADTIALDTIPFTATQTGSTITLSSPVATLTYTAIGDGFRTNVHGTLSNGGVNSTLLIDLPPTLRSIEADTLDDMRHLAFGYKMPRRDVASLSFGKLDPGAVKADTGLFQWVSVRTKYWLVALMQPVGADKPAGVFRGFATRGGPRTGKVPNVAYATTTQPITAGTFAFDLYVGPQSWPALHALGNDLENVNPYAGWLHGIVQPFATIMMRVLLWMKATLRVNYGWVLVLFGAGIRLLLWPLNQKAMRSSIQMQRLQPELSEIQRRYKNEPEKQREALVKVYQSHGMSPFSPMLGCLPMLLPMPLLFALYFVFQNTIEFRGVSFLWLPDISLRDPYYITPLVMGASMFLLSWIGMRAAPPNPQAKMMSYTMPAMFTVMFLNFASGLNLYYAIQNIAALPQQWILTRERAKAGLGTPSARKT